MQVTVQGQQAENIISQFENYRQHYLEEKIFVHTDKKNYLAGEICWFKIYLVDAYFHKPLNFDKVAYVEISDKNNKPLLQAKIALDKGTGSGSFNLPATVSTGNYRLRAYTNWMKNGGPDYFFEKNISIINVQKYTPEINVPQKKAYEIAFFPEGGNLVNGIRSKVGFKANDQFGRGIDFEGVLVNDKGDTVTVFHPLKFGIGNFSFTPVEGVQYRAIVKTLEGEQLQQELPAAFNNGYVMRLEHTNGQIQVTVSKTGTTENLKGELFLLVHTRNVIKAARSSGLQNGTGTFVFNDTLPGDGISHFTLFNEQKQPVCERLYFKRPAQTLQVKAVTDQTDYSFRKKINVDVISATEKGAATSANMSMAVYRIDSLNTIDPEAINNYLLLTADLSGSVESPEYYFENDNDAGNIALDNLMLTQGWRKFKWEDVLANKKSTISFLPEINGHIITGKVTSSQPGLPVKYLQAYLSAPGTRTQVQTAAADEAGNLKFEMKDFYTNGELIVQTDKSDSLCRIDIDPPFFPGNSSRKIPAFYFSGKQEALLKTYVAAQVQNSFLSNKLNLYLLPAIDTTAFYLKPTTTYLLDNYVRFTTLEEVLREYVPEVLVRRRNNKFNLVMFDPVNKYVYELSPLVLLDGVPVFDFDKLVIFDALKIRKLEVETKKYFLGKSSFYGIVNFTTYKGDLAGFEIDPHAAVIDYEGLQLKREFYSPVYNTPEQVAGRIPDYRNLLYWSPDVVTNNNGKYQTNFFTSDLPGRYAVVIQGLSDDGRAGSTVVYFNVNKP